MFTGIQRATAFTYLAVELRPGEPVRLPDGYPAPSDGVHAFVVELESDGHALVTLPVYVPAPVLVDYEAFVLLVLEQTGEMFSCEAIEQESCSARQRSAWRRHIASAIGASHERPPGDSAVPAESVRRID